MTYYGDLAAKVVLDLAFFDSIGRMFFDNLEERFDTHDDHLVLRC